jgi:hypothetical protein
MKFTSAPMRESNEKKRPIRDKEDFILGYHRDDLALRSDTRSKALALRDSMLASGYEIKDWEMGDLLMRAALDHGDVEQIVMAAKKTVPASPPFKRSE